MHELSASPAPHKTDAPTAFSLSATFHKRFNGLGGWVGSSSSLSTTSSSPPESLASSLAPPSDSPYGQGASALNSLASTLALGRSESPSSHAKAHAVEGSLGSVTAYSSARGHHVHAPAGLNGKRVQGLAEMHEANVLKKPLKAIFVPPREVSPAASGVQSFSPNVRLSRYFVQCLLL